MKMQAYLSSGQHPECGAVSVTFPIPEQEYDRILDLLRPMGIGDAVQRDCQLSELGSDYSALKCLEGQAVNLDELDYLSKRLDSFETYEKAQFEAALSKLGLTDMTDIINLTFCCQDVTVITDFSDLEQIGKTHFLTTHGGTQDELDALNGYETALLLIDSGTGIVTPYGVLYDNGMKLEQLYDGQVFPVYYYDNYGVSMIIAPTNEPKQETLLYPRR